MITACRRLRLAAVVAACGLALAGCELAGDAAEPGTSPTPVDPARAAAPPDPRQEALVDAVAELESSVAAAHAALEAGDVDLAVALLTASADLAGSAADDDLPAPPLLPGPATSREETIDYGDSFTTTLTAARNAGQSGAAVLGLLRDAVAGDLGSWQRDAAGMLDQIEAAAETRGSVAEVEAAVIELSGEASRALAYALRARASDGEDLQAYTERALAHLDVITSTIDDLALPLEAPSDG